MTTLGACAVCNRTTPKGSGWVLGGAAAMGAGVLAALVASHRAGLEAISGQACAVAMAVGGALIITGLLRGVRTGRRSFALGKLVVPPGTALRGDALEVGVVVMPDHALHLRESRLELQALQAEGDVETVLKTYELGLPLPSPLRETVTQQVKVEIPRDWPVTAEILEDGRRPRLITTRLRAFVDTEAHPVLLFEAPVRIASAR